MKKTTLLSLSILLIGMNSSFAQTLEDAKRFIYYERFKSAKTILQKLVASEPQNEEAIYWLGQSIIRPDESGAKEWTEAKNLYQSKLSNKENTLIMTGIGHIELLEGKTADARNHFEAAISMSQAKSISVLNAIGFANGNPDAKNGDPQYAVDKLKQATQIKKFNDPDVWVNMGDAYRKLGDGGNALLSYQSALTLNAKYARASYRIGRMYQSQGRGQEAIFMEHYNNAMNADPNYAPVYATLFNYNYQTNVNLAAEYFEKWLTHSDEDIKSCYYRASLKYAQGLFQDAIGKANECIAGSKENPYSKLYGILALAYNKINDSVHTVESYEKYLEKESPENITAEDYANYMKNLAKFSGNKPKISIILAKLVQANDYEQERVKAIKETAKIIEEQKDYLFAAELYKSVLSVKKSPNNLDLYNIAYNYYRSESLDSSLRYYELYGQKYPNEILPFFMSGKVASIIDSTLTSGLAVPHYEKAIQIGLTDTVKYKSQLMASYKYLFQYYAIGKKDIPTATTYINKAISLDPADADAIKFKSMLSAPPAKQTNQPKQIKKP